MILFLRSLAFNIVWYVNILLQMVLQTPFYFFLSHKNAVKVPKRWARSTNWFHKILAGTDVEVTGQENLPEGGYIVASKHQSIWEFYALYALLEDSAFVLKSELMKIPFFGWYVAKLDHIPIRRGDKGKALRQMLRDASKEVEKGRQILIFPEGTRRSPGAEPSYRYGVVRLYLELNCPVVPVALNSGLYWPRRKFVRYPGIIRTRFLEPIMPGLSGPEFAAELERRIEEACDQLYLEASQDNRPPPLSAEAQAAIERARMRNEQ